MNGENEINEVKNDVKDIKNSLNVIKIEIAKQTVDWNHHVKRTDINDKRIDTLQKFMWLNLGGIAVVQVILALGIKFFKG